ncbi:MULTIHEME_CYTC domain-containing protein [Rubrivivax sp. A210]|uniref:NapC/NirT family cytochrome c n=1 Tax=Rubrivivax sp. A210 TaxID=2772301 RepID=UPI0019189498|nr:NapC/NirT family cytochrome c [Rubrivivax sp. A210]CAD5366290.1 MULTIHEME_CYTC domain-containing protein [Rubrivivax sp. A210]
MRTLMRGRLLFFGSFTAMALTLLGVAVFGAVGIAGWEYTNSNAFCATMCHNVHPEEIASHQVNVHARVNCVECHMGRNSTLHLMALKPTHAKELWGMIAGYERPITSGTLRPSREACEGCHLPTAEHRDGVDVKVHYASDDKSTESRTKIVLHTGMEAIREGYSKGIHWHVKNEVRFVSPDPQRREIPWVEVVKADGSKVTYTDAETKLKPDELAALKPRAMACYDCHNSIGHPFPNPEKTVDEAIRTGRIDRSLPNVKARAVALVGKLGDITGETEARQAQVDKLVAEAAAKAATPVDKKAAEDKFNKSMGEILMAASFREKGFSWKSFPNHTGHADTPGCFRCHDGKHFNDKGEAIRLQCTLCHAMPEVMREDGKGTVASLVPAKAGEKQPESHQRPNFMHTHADDVGPTCEECHGTPLKRGKQGGNFCANPACHGRTWPGLNMVEPPKKAATAVELPKKS